MLLTRLVLLLMLRRLLLLSEPAEEGAIGASALARVGLVAVQVAAKLRRVNTEPLKMKILYLVL